MSEDPENQLSPRVIDCWLTQCDGGRYLITLLVPIIAPIKGRRPITEDAFEQVGEPLCVKNLCAPMVQLALGMPLPPLKPTRAKLAIWLADSPPPFTP